MATDTPYSEALEIPGLVTYQEGSIVSRMLVNKKAGTITVFAFAKGQGLSEHSAPFDAIVEVIEGEGVFVIGGEEHLVRAGEMIIMPADIPHGVRAEMAFKMILTLIHGE